ncbi:MAG: polysaccharide biosynthesis/export family protein [Planctomycetota bacterium]|nr:polysaccharide biosynthesis/export family protein [Planctomycetota bacterium]
MRSRRAAGVVLLVALLSGCASSEPPPPDALERYWRRPGKVEASTDPGQFQAWTNRGVYVLGPGDVLGVSVQDLLVVGQRFSETIEIDADGTITLPIVGPLEAAGLSAGELRDTITAALQERYLEQPQVSVSVQDHKSKEIAVLGAVKRPGALPLRRNTTTVLGAIALAGGMSDDLGPRGRLLRGSGVEDGRPLVIEIDLERLNGGDLGQNYVMYPGDILQVLPADRYFVTGWVNKPGEFAFKRGTTVLEALAIAGGVITPDASPDLTRILRPGEPEIVVDYTAILEGEANDILLRPGDLVEVRQGFWRWAGLGLGRFIVRGVIFGYNLASLIP